jgi:hypothetical protein
MRRGRQPIALLVETMHKVAELEAELIDRLGDIL